MKPCDSADLLKLQTLIRQWPQAMPAATAMPLDVALRRYLEAGLPLAVFATRYQIVENTLWSAWTTLHNLGMKPTDIPVLQGMTFRTGLTALRLLERYTTLRQRALISPSLSFWDWLGAWWHAKDWQQTDFDADTFRLTRIDTKLDMNPGNVTVQLRPKFVKPIPVVPLKKSVMAPNLMNLIKPASVLPYFARIPAPPSIYIDYQGAEWERKSGLGMSKIYARYVVAKTSVAGQIWLLTLHQWGALWAESGSWEDGKERSGYALVLTDEAMGYIQGNVKVVKKAGPDDKTASLDKLDSLTKMMQAITKANPAKGATLQGWIGLSGLSVFDWEYHYRQCRADARALRTPWSLSFFDWAQLLVRAGAWGVGRFQPELFELTTTNPELGYLIGNTKVQRRMQANVA